MSISFRKTLLAVGVLVTAAFGATGMAHAEPNYQRGNNFNQGGYNRGNDNHQYNRWQNQQRFSGKRPEPQSYRIYNNAPSRVFVIRNDDRTVIHNYMYRNYYRPGFPYAPHNFVIGQPLRPDVYFYEVPPQLLVQLQPAPYGYRYVRVDGDLLLISDLNRIVVDSVTLM